MSEVLVHYHHGKKRVSMQADRVLEKEPRVLHLDRRQQDTAILGLTLGYETSKPASIVTHFL